MLRVARFACCIAVLVLVSGSGCEEDRPRARDRTPSTSAPATPTSSPTASPTVTEPTASTSSTPTSAATDRLSGIAERTGYTITHDGRPIDKAGLRAIGWTVNPGLGNAQWSDPTLGAINVTWEVPDQRAIAFFDVSLWGDVTGQNLAMSPTMYVSVFTGEPVEATAHSTGGAKAETPTELLRVTVPEQPVGTTAKVELNLSWPQPVLVTYTYTYV